MKSAGARSGTRRTVVAATLACAAALLTACGSSAGGAGADVKQTDSGGAITIWVDPPRVPAAKAFKKAYPDIKITINQIDGTVGGKSLQQQFAQFNQAGKGWPDAIFFPSNDDIAWASGAQINYAADLTDLVPGRDQGLRPGGDRAVQHRRQDPLPAQRRRARRVLVQQEVLRGQTATPRPRPGRSTATLAVEIAEGAPGQGQRLHRRRLRPRPLPVGLAAARRTHRLSPRPRSTSTSTDPKCQRAKELARQDGRRRRRSPTLGIFDADAAKVGKDLVMSPGAAWWGDYLFRQTWKIPAGQMTAVDAAELAGREQAGHRERGRRPVGRLAATSPASSWRTRSRSPKFVATDPRWQVELSTGLPAYGAGPGRVGGEAGEAEVLRRQRRRRSPR